MWFGVVFLEDGQRFATVRKGFGCLDILPSESTEGYQQCFPRTNPNYGVQCAPLWGAFLGKTFNIYHDTCLCRLRESSASSSHHVKEVKKSRGINVGAHKTEVKSQTYDRNGVRRQTRSCSIVEGSAAFFVPSERG